MVLLKKFISKTFLSEKEMDTKLLMLYYDYW